MKKSFDYLQLIYDEVGSNAVPGGNLGYFDRKQRKQTDILSIKVKQL